MVCSVTGDLFFASSNDLVTWFNYATDPERVVIDLFAAHIWDARPSPSASPMRGAILDHALRAQRNPAWPLELSGVLAVRAATR